MEDPDNFSVGLLPHANSRHHHLRFRPGGKPVLLRAPEILLGRQTLVHPRLRTPPVREPAVRASHAHIQNEVEVLVEGGVGRAALPGVLDRGPVAVGEGEAAARPQRFEERGVDDLEKAVVDVGEEVLLAPFHAEDVFARRVRRVQGLPLHVRLPPGVGGGRGAPVQSAAHDVVAPLPVAVVVAARLYNVDLPAGGPGSVFVAHRHHPDGRPQPVALRQDRRHFHATVADRGAFFGVDAAGFDGWDDGAIGGVCGGVAVIECRAGAVCQGEVVVCREQLIVL